jgi:hypothetical protein
LLKLKKKKKEFYVLQGHGSSGRTPAWHVKDPEFKPQCTLPKKKKKEFCILYLLGWGQVHVSLEY